MKITRPPVLVAFLVGAAVGGVAAVLLFVNPAPAPLPPPPREPANHRVRVGNPPAAGAEVDPAIPSGAPETGSPAPTATPAGEPGPGAPGIGAGLHGLTRPQTWDRARKALDLTDAQVADLERALEDQRAAGDRVASALPPELWRKFREEGYAAALGFDSPPTSWASLAPRDPETEDR